MKAFSTAALGVAGVCFAVLSSGCQPGEQVMRGTGEGVRKDSSFVRIMNFGSTEAHLKLGQSFLGGRVAPGEVSMPVPAPYGERSLRLLLGSEGKEKEFQAKGEYKSGEVHTVVVMPDGSFLLTSGEPRKVANDIQLVVKVLEPGSESATLASPLNLSSDSGTVKIDKTSARVEAKGLVEVSGAGVDKVSEALDPEWTTTLFVLKGASPKAVFAKNGVTVKPAAMDNAAGG